MVGVKLAKGIGFLDISQKTGTWERSGAPPRQGSFQRTGGVHCEKRRPPIIVLTRAEQEVATIPGQQAGFKEEFLRRI